MKTTIIKMSNAYEHQSFICGLSEPDIIDCRDIESTKCYCDDEACIKLRQRLADAGFFGIHFIDSGNYHYLSLFFLEQIKEDFNLLLIDHHPDDQPPGFGDILSCGGWVLKAKEELPYLNNVYSFGLKDTDSSDILAFTDSIPTDLPLYISIDKDALSKDFAITDWDQGSLALPQLLDLLEAVCSNRKLLGIDICGDTCEEDLDASDINSSTNSILFDFFKGKF
ncbi:MAG: hypothetical protein HUJ98_04440 [Bacteroidaceae bacterium]|nr:hypothetical protein [Bacteroidaceae bacterium]